MGHAIGLPDTYDAKDRDKIMYGFLTNGERRVPARGDAAIARTADSGSPRTAQSAGSNDPSSNSKPQFLAAPVNVGVIPAGKSVTVRFHAAIASPLPSGTTQISSQGTVSGSNFSNVLTDDTALGGTSDPTITPVDVPTRTFSAGDPPDGTVGAAYTYNFVADGNPAPAYALHSGTLPPGLTLSSSGVLSGTPTAGGTFSGIVVRATNTDGVSTLGFADAAFDIVISVSGSSTTIASAPNPSNYGQAVTFTATVGPNFGAQQPTGTVTFKDGAATLGTGTLGNAGGTATATYTTTSAQLAAGGHSITAVYSGNPGYAPSVSSALSQTVNKGTATEALLTSKNPTVSGETVSFQVTVSPVAPATTTPTGTVQFLVDNVAFGSPVALNGAGFAQISNSTLNAGPHTIKADYSGDGNYLTSTASTSQTVNKDATTTSVTSSANPSATRSERYLHGYGHGGSAGIRNTDRVCPVCD